MKAFRRVTAGRVGSMVIYAATCLAVGAVAAAATHAFVTRHDSIGASLFAIMALAGAGLAAVGYDMLVDE